MHFRLNSPDVAQEPMDEEVIVVHLPSGSYYSIVGTAAAIWKPLIEGVPVDVIGPRLAAGSDTPVDDVNRIVGVFVEQLLSEQLIVPTDRSQPSADSAAVAIDGSRTAFAAPVLAKFTDMQELLLVDPIHEVEPTGWPARALEEG
jgi:hypothetical protein